MADDDIEKLLREVEATLNPGAASGGRKPAGSAPERGSAQGGGAGASDAGDKGMVARVRDGVPVAVAAGAVSGAVVWVVFAVVPFVSSLSGAVGAFVGAAGVSLAGRLRRR
jgi:hypothetical protein